MENCPICKQELTTPAHTDSEIRELGVDLNWDNLSVCEDCYNVLRSYREIVNADADASESSI